MHTWMLKILALFLALTLAAAACGNDDSTSADQPGDDVAGEPADVSRAMMWPANRRAPAY